MDVLPNLSVVIISHCIHISNCRVVYLKYMNFICQYTSIKLDKKICSVVVGLVRNSERWYTLSGWQNTIYFYNWCLSFSENIQLFLEFEISEKFKMKNEFFVKNSFTIYHRKPFLII